MRFVWKHKEHGKERYYFSYQSKLTLIFTVMTVSVIITFVSIMFKRQEDNLTQRMYRSVQVENQKNAVALGNVFETIRDLSAALALNENIYESISELPYIVGKKDYKSLKIQQDIFKTMLISKLATMSQMQDMRLYSCNGMSIHVTKQRSNIVEWNYWEQGWFEPFVIHNKDWMFSFSWREEVPILTICRTVREIVPGNLVGYLEVNFDFSQEIKQILDAVSLKDGYRYYLLQQDSLMITNDKEAAHYLGQKLEDEILKVFSELKEDHVTTLMLDGKEFLMMSSPVEKTDFVLISGVASSVLKEQTREEYHLLLLILLTGTLGAIGISVYAAKGLSWNIQKLNNAMREADRNPDIQVSITSRDEIGMLGQSFNRMIVRLQKTYANLYETELDLKDAQNLALQAQINPHFLYNTLEMIDALSVCERTEDIGKIVQSLSKVFRYAMEEKRCVPLKEELIHVSEYLSILALRYENRFTWEVIVEDDLVAEGLLQELEIPKIVLQPLVENAIIHSILKLERKGKIILKICRINGWIRLCVIDDGAGMTTKTLQALRVRLSPEENQERSEKHIGIQNVDRRMRYFFGDQYHMEISSIPEEETQLTFCIRESTNVIK